MVAPGVRRMLRQARRRNKLVCEEARSDSVAIPSDEADNILQLQFSMSAHREQSGKPDDFLA